MPVKIEQSSVVPLLCGMLSIVLGGAVLLGWYAHNEALIQIYPEFAPMQYNTALGFLLSGIGLAALTCDRPHIGLVCGVVIAALGVTTFMQYILGLNFGIDEFFMDAYVMVKTSHSGRMAPNTALCFSLVGIALIFSGAAQLKKLAVMGTELLGLTVLGLASMALLGYGLGIEQAYGWTDLTRMAIHTTLGFLVLGIGLLGYAWTREKIKIASIPLWVPIAILTGIICMELYTPLGVASGVLYVPLVFCSLWFNRHYVPFIFAGVTSFLIVAGYFTAPHEAADEHVIILNRSLSVMAVWVTAIIVALQKRTQEKLGKSEERMRQTIVNAPIGIAMVGLKGEWIEVNPALCELVGYSKEELLEIDFQTITHPDDLDADLELFQQLHDNKIPSYEMEKRYLHKDGHVIWILLTVGTVRDAFGKPLYYISQILDLTQRKEAEQRLLQSQKMEIIGQLTGGIAHDFNNLLTIIFGNTRLLNQLIDEPGDDKEAWRKKVETIQKAAHRGAGLVKRMMIFSRQKLLKPETVNINDVITGMDDLLQRSLGEMVEIKTSFANNLWNINIDPIMLEHVLINLGVNARDAMLDGGTLGIETENVTIDKDTIPDIDITPGSYVMLTISDTGTGMPEEVRKKIFDPFFTTKEVGKGTGLGLSMVYGFIKDSGGTIHVYSEQGRGTTFRLYLPKAEGQAIQSTTTRTEKEDSPRGHETILVVEDEEEIRSLTTLILESHGYTVIGAGNGPEALDLLIKNGGNVDLLFTDIAMPGEMNGVQLAGRAQSVKPELKLLFTTGYAGDTVPDMNLAQDYAMIDKPYQPPALIRKIRQVLDRKEAA